MHQQPGPNMTQLHGARSGHLVWSRRRHYGAADRCQYRRHPDHGFVHGGAPPGRLPVGDGGAREGCKVIHVDPRFTRTSAMADIWLPLRAGHGHYLSWRADPLRARHMKSGSRNMFSITPMHRLSCARIFGTAKRAGFFPAGMPEKRSNTIPKTWLYEGSPSKEGGDCRALKTTAAGMPKIAEVRPATLGEHKTDPTLQNPRCVFQVLKATFRPLHAGDGRALLRRSQREISGSCGSLHIGFRARSKTAASVTPWDGRSIPPACRLFAPPRFCNCCWETSAVPAVAFWRCAATHPFRARQIFRRFMTFCPAICPCLFSRTIQTSWRSI